MSKLRAVGGRGSAKLALALEQQLDRRIDRHAVGCARLDVCAAFLTAPCRDGGGCGVERPCGRADGWRRTGVCGRRARARGALGCVGGRAAVVDARAVGGGGVRI